MGWTQNLHGPWHWILYRGLVRLRLTILDSPQDYNYCWQLLLQHISDICWALCRVFSIILCCPRSAPKPSKAAWSPRGSRRDFWEIMGISTSSVSSNSQDCFFIEVNLLNATKWAVQWIIRSFLVYKRRIIIDLYFLGNSYESLINLFNIL